MIEYIYFVKCPNCEDEPFTFFDDAKSFACGCLSKNPTITQVEIDRNDFGECVDSRDLGTVWSWEDMMNDIPSDVENNITFSKQDFVADATTDNVDFFNEFDDDIEPVSNVTQGVSAKPVPSDMTIEALVETMEANEDTVECKECNELFDKQTMHYQEGVGYFCEACAPKHLSEDVSDQNLTEALKDYPFAYLRGEHLLENGTDSITVKNQILDLLEPQLGVGANGASFMFYDRELHCFKCSAYAAYNCYGYGAAILDFAVTEAGHILVKYRHSRTHAILFDDLEEMFDGLTSGCSGSKVLRAIYKAALKVNNQYKPGIGQRRNTQVADWLSQMQDKVELFRQHIVNITYEIPLNYSDSDLDRNGEPVSEGAFRNLDKIYNNFINDLTPELANAAIDSGMVIDRSADTDTSHNIEKSWHGIAKITFDRKVSELDQAMQDIISAAKFRKDGAVSDDFNTRTVNAYRLANELIKHFGDLKFYNNNGPAPTEPTDPAPLVASANRDNSHLDTLEEAASYRERLILCDECMTASLDEETGICINCGAVAKIDVNDTKLTEENHSWLDDSQKSMLEAFIADATTECERARTAGRQNVHQVTMPWELRDQACKQHLIESLEKAGFPGGQTVSYDDELVFVPLNDKGKGYSETMERFYTQD